MLFIIFNYFLDCTLASFPRTPTNTYIELEIRLENSQTPKVPTLNNPNLTQTSPATKTQQWTHSVQ